MDNDLFSSLLSDPSKLQSAVSAISGMFGGEGGGESAPPSPQAPPASSHIPQQQSAPAQQNYDPSSDLMGKALPVISGIMQSGQKAVNTDKRTLLNAIKPFVTSDVSRQFDHAMRLVSTARMAQAALSQLGNKENENDPSVRSL